MKPDKLLIATRGLTILAFLLTSCNREITETETYPIVYEYQNLAFSPTLWYALTPNAQNQLSQVPGASSFDNELKDLLEEAASFELPFQRVELLSESTVKVTYTDGISTLDTVLTYTKVDGKINIQLGPSLEEALIFYEAAVPHTLHLGITSTFYSYKLPNGSIDYSPVDIRFSPETDAINILNELRSSKNLQPNDTVAVNVAAYVFQ